MFEQRVYANREHLSRFKPPALNDLCRAIWSEEPLERRLQSYGSRAWLFAAADSPENASLWILPLFWNDYVEQDFIPLAEQEAQRAARAGQRLLIFSQGDFTANIPFTNVILFERSSYASRRNRGENYVYAYPAFIPDYVQLYCDGQVQVRKKNPIPVVGFCGQAGGSKLDFARREITTRLRRISFRIGWRKWEPSPIESTRLRSRILKEICECPEVRANFLIRSRYRAGYMPIEKDPFHHTRMEFIQNILESDYTVCVRGNGNFSVRFFETLALGRIPIVINTDCLLPFDHRIEYRQYCVWVEENEIPRIGEKVVAFHNSFSPTQFKDLQLACYALWQKWLSMDGFYTNLSEHYSVSAYIP